MNLPNTAMQKDSHHGNITVYWMVSYTGLEFKLQRNCKVFPDSVEPECSTKRVVIAQILSLTQSRSSSRIFLMLLHALTVTARKLKLWHNDYPIPPMSTRLVQQVCGRANG